MKYRRPLGKRPSMTDGMKGTGSVGRPSPPHAPRGTPAQAVSRVISRRIRTESWMATGLLGKGLFMFIYYGNQFGGKMIRVVPGFWYFKRMLGVRGFPQTPSLSSRLSSLFPNQQELNTPVLPPVVPVFILDNSLCATHADGRKPVPIHAETDKVLQHGLRPLLAKWL